MQILKGTSLGVGIFLVLGVIWFLFWLRPKGTQFAVGISAIKAMTIINPLFWATFACCLVIGYMLVRFLSRS